MDTPVQAVGGLSVAQNRELTNYGVHHLVLGVAVDADSFSAPKHDVEALPSEIIGRLKPERH